MHGTDDVLSDPGFWFGLVGAVVAIGGMVFQWMERLRTARQDQVTYLQQRVTDLELKNNLCEMRCEELREEMLDLLAQRNAPRRRRKVAAAQQ